ncbi:MAG: phage minor capsid protein [Lactobacillus sp.]|nr:phage minor capsid protein [Lactococcus sp.]MDN6589853.1 phage minor capsid protein [Lactobacillus sp.]MDN6663151.1 phage minor capsid protein [Tetragenococcus koreensis]
MPTLNQMENQADDIVNVYSALEDKIFNLIIKTLRDTDFSEISQENVLLWQMEQLNKMGVLNENVIDYLSSISDYTSEQLKKLIRSNGNEIVDDIDNELKRMSKRSVPVSSEVDAITDSLVNQTFEDLNNNINQTMLTTNYDDNQALRAYQAIVKQSTLETMTGLKTHEKAIRDNVYKLVDEGIKSDFVDKAGREWSMESYSRMVVETTAHRTYNDLRLKRMEDFDVVTALMSSHPAAREACAPIQGQVVNVVPMSDSRANPRYDSIYNHGYGDPAGTQGINCHHNLWPFIPDVNTNNQPQYDSEKAQENAEIQQRQRRLERDIRRQKKRLLAAEELEDKDMQQKCKDVIRAKQKQIRELLEENDFLVRDYSREQVQSPQSSIFNEVQQTIELS